MAGQVKFISKTVADNMTAEELIVYCARVSSGKSDEDRLKNPEKLLKYCLDHGHYSIFELADMTVEVETTIPIAMQMIRHKSFSVQQFSARYQQVQGIEEIEIRREHEKNRQSSTERFNPKITMVDAFGEWEKNADELIQNYMDYGSYLYKQLLKAGVARECARFVLPQAAETVLFFKGSLRSWIHYIELRTKEDTQKEHREIAEQCKVIFTEQFPIIAKALW